MTALPAKSYRFGRFVVDARSGGLRRDGAPVPLRPKSFDVLAYLARNRGRLVTKDELFDHVWGNIVVTENSLAQCISDVRQALEDHDQTIIETVAKRGYIFTPAVTECEDAPVAATGIAPVDPVLPCWRGSPNSCRQAADRRCWRRHRDSAHDRRRAVVGVEPATEPRNRPTRDSTALTVSRWRCCLSAYRVKPPTTISPSASAKTLRRRLAAFPTWPSLRRRSSRVLAARLARNDNLQRELKVRYLVEGSVRRTPERIRISVRLTDLPRGTLLWSESYELVGGHDLRD